MKILQCFSSEATVSLGMILSLAGTKLSLEMVCIGGGQGWGGVRQLQDTDPITGYPKLIIYK